MIITMEIKEITTIIVKMTLMIITIKVLKILIITKTIRAIVIKKKNKNNNNNKNIDKYNNNNNNKNNFVQFNFFSDRPLVAPYWGLVSSTDASQGATPCIYNCRPTRD